MEESFARVETKYHLTQEQEKKIEQGLAKQGFAWMDFGDPTVQSLYYDTPDHALIRTSLERPAYKEKLRLRAYGRPGTQNQFFVEIKKKYDGVVYKRREAYSLRTASRILDQGMLPKDAGQVAREAEWMVKRYGLLPSAVIAYERDAWFSEQHPDVRITFDRNITFRQEDCSLLSRTPGLPLSEPGERLMEVKTGGIYPLWLSRLLWEAEAERIHFSKYGLAYERYIAKGKHKEVQYA